MQEIERHRCEVREWLKRGIEEPKEWVKQLFVDIAKRRGAKAAQRLKDDISDQWKRGNRGEWGDWRNE